MPIQMRYSLQNERLFLKKVGGNVRIADCHKDCNNMYLAYINNNEDELIFTTDPFPTYEQAIKYANTWIHWSKYVQEGKAESIYYILLVPETWAGPPPGSHPYSGLHFKIGRTKNVRKRVQNLQTGSSGQLILHALEPGSSERESELHKKFCSERRQGEWFVCSPKLFRHVMSTWYRHRLLPPEYQKEIKILADRISAYRQMRKFIDGAPDMVNPSINEEWHGTVFLDLAYTSLLKRTSGKE